MRGIVYGLLARAGVLLLALSLFACSAETPSVTPLKVGTNLWLGYEPLYAARATKRLDPEHVRLLEFTSATDVARSFRNGVLDVAALTLDEALDVAQYVPDMRIVLIVDFSNGADVLMARNGTRQVEQLRGKKVGAENLAVGAFMLARAMQLHKLSADVVDIVPLPYSEHVSALQQGRVDAVVTYEPAVSQLQAKGAVRLFDSSQIPGEIVDVLVTRDSVLHGRSESLRYLVNGWFDAVSALQKGDPALLESMTRRQQLDVAELRVALKSIAFPQRDENRLYLLSRPSPLDAVMRGLLQHMQDNRMLTDTPDYLRLYPRQLDYL